MNFNIISHFVSVFQSNGWWVDATLACNNNHEYEWALGRRIIKCPPFLACITKLHDTELMTKEINRDYSHHHYPSSWLSTVLSHSPQAVSVWIGNFPHTVEWRRKFVKLSTWWFPSSRDRIISNVSRYSPCHI